MLRSKLTHLFWSCFLPALLLSVMASGLWQTVASRAATSSGIFIDSGQRLGNATTLGVALGDLDGDNDLDAFAANTSANRVWFNNGSATFSSNGQFLGNSKSNGVALGALNGDTFLDAFVVNDGANSVWFNIGTGIFTDSGQAIGGGTAASLGVALADLDGDSDLDAFIANDGNNEVWFNQGGAQSGQLGQFSLAQTLGDALTSRDVVLGDVDGDGDPDALIANGNTSSQASQLWINQGGAQNGTPGVFADSGQLLDLSWTYGAALGDVDNDQDADILLASWDAADTLWINQGGKQAGIQGQFVLNSQSFSGSGSTSAQLADVDGDNDLDAVIGRWSPNGNEVWLNDGSGGFTNSGQSIDSSATYAVALGRLDSDLDLDLMAANFGPNQVWLNGQTALPAARFDVDARLNDDGHLRYPWAMSGNAQLPVQLSSPAPLPMQVTAHLTYSTGVLTRSIPFGVGELRGSLSVDNPGQSPSATVLLALGSGAATLAHRFQAAVQTGDLGLVFVDPGKTEPFCLLCNVDWILKLMGFDTSFWIMHHADLPDLEGSQSWEYYRQLFRRHTPELTTVVITNPTLLWDTFSLLEAWTPAVQALDSGQGDLFVVSQTLMDDTNRWLDDLAGNAGPELAAAIALERSVLNGDAWVGEDMDRVSDRIQQRIQGQLYLPAVSKP